nr:hypothetical protein [Tanacetum cinerariifolium]
DQERYDVQEMFDTDVLNDEEVVVDDNTVATTTAVPIDDITLAQALGVPHVIVSDQDSRFTGRFWTKLFNIMGMDLNFFMSFHPQTDGQAERVNALLELYLWHYGCSLAAFKTIKEWHKQADVARVSLDKATKKMKKWEDERRRHVEFEVEDQVMVKLFPQQFKSLRKIHKGLIWRYEGPFPVIGYVGKALTTVVTSYDREVEEILSDRTIRRRGVPSYKEYLIK